MLSLISKFFPNVVANQDQFVQAIGQTLYMTAISIIIAGIFGVVFGVILVVTEPNQLLENKFVYQIVDKIINIFRAIPFIILLALLTPVTRAIIGTSIGTTAAIVPLVLGCSPFYARQIQNALAEVDPGMVEASQAIGLTPLDIIIHVYLKEGLSEIVRVSIVTIISLISLTAMAGAVGAGGLGDIAITLGYNQFENDVTIAATAIILIMVLLIQLIGDFFIRRLEH
ncbi:methionine ABC transporter permease [Loigolactobacillus backii]|uniref:methionine ABC transporter permease n=1 Tax=Loigolactobacillus backii TaxID=375175 RepID=UPI003AABA5CF